MIGKPMGGIDRHDYMEVALMRSLLAALLLISPALGSAQDTAKDDGGVQGQAPQRVRSVLLRAGERCPPSANNEIVVCSTIEEPYRIPRKLRESAPTAANRTWASRVAEVDDVSRRDGGLPGSCSPIGAAGQTGCTQALVDRWRTERRAAEQGNPVP